MGQLMGLCHRGMNDDTEYIIIVLGTFAYLSVIKEGKIQVF
jgi:hypothetical protein